MDLGRPVLAVLSASSPLTLGIATDSIIRMSREHRQRNLGYFFDDALARGPDKVAVIDLFGGQERCSTYRRLDARMDCIARMLARLGVRPGERVAMLVGNRTEFLEFFFGSMRAGAIPLPLNIRLAAATLTDIIREAACMLALFDPAAHRDALSIARNLPLRQRLLLDSSSEGFLPFEDEMAKPAAAIEPPVIDADTQAFQPYTSGSTGRPKGAIMTHRGMLWYVAYNQRYWPAAESDRGLIALPLFHKNALRGTVKPMLYAGGSFVLMPGYEPRPYLEALAKYRCTYSRGVAAVFTMFLQHRDYLESLDLSALRSMTIGSAVVAPELVEAVERALPHVKVSESYGLTEGGSPLRAPVDGHPVPRGSPGVAAPEVEVRLVDSEGRDAEEGELLVRCPYVCLGYYNEPEITRQKLHDGWLRTGDIFCKDGDGFFYFRSRVDDMFSCGGENVYPKEVENLLFAHPDVVNAVVAPVPHTVKGFVPAAMVVAREGSKITADALRAHCLERGPAFSHPRFIAIVPSLPLNGAGKVDRGMAQVRLRDAFAAQATNRQSP
ncbi:MAG TPA: class I adenylate-forming enzyme family protein [Xanthobacteraceae bacterium]|jgi:long-chain acyl-CoA synthetase